MKKIFLILLSLIIIGVYLKNEDTIIIPDTSIRLRVIPNSNDPYDIHMKEKVLEYLEKNVYDITKYTNTIEEARYQISSNIPTIESDINEIFTNNSYDKYYNVNFGYNYFPEKMYRGIKYQEGYYESLVIKIGEAKGDNWWCVLFPNYCLIDKESKQEYHLYIKDLITKHSKKKKTT